MLSHEDLREGWRRANPQEAFTYSVLQLRKLYPESYAPAVAMLGRSINGQNGALRCMNDRHVMAHALKLRPEIPLKSGFRLVRVLHPAEAADEYLATREREGHLLWQETARLSLALLFERRPGHGRLQFRRFELALRDIMKMLEHETRRSLAFLCDENVMGLVLRHQYWSHLLDAWCAVQSLPLPILQGIRVMREEGIHPLWISDAQEVTAVIARAQT